MNSHDLACIAVRCGTGILLPFSGCASVAATQETVWQIDEIIVTTKRPSGDLTVIAPDAASLIATPGDVNDPLKALQSLPGITFAGSDLDDPVIRGGGPRDNLFLIDGVPVENVFHELSDSIVSPNVIRTFDFHGAAFDPQYGNAVGGVIDIQLRDPNSRNSRLNVDLSQLKSGFLFETPVTDKIAVYGAYRHNLAHLFLKEFERGNDILVFQMPESRDYTARAIWRGSKTDVTFTAFGSWNRTEEIPRDDTLIDTLGERETRQLDVQSVRIRSALSARTSLAVTIGNSLINEDRQEAGGSFTRRDATDLSFRGQLTHNAGRHQLLVGVNHLRADNELAFRGFLPLCDRLERNCGGAFSQTPATLEEVFQSTEIFVNDRFSVTDRLTLNIGVHGAVDHFLDETFIEPRLGVSYEIEDDITVYFRGGRHHAAPDVRNLLVLNSVADLQQSERSTQMLVGGRWNISDGWRLQAETWWKDFELTELVGTPLERRLDGKAYGIDLLLAKPISERLYGWVALSLSDGTVAVPGLDPDINNRFALPVSATVAASYAFDHGWKIGAKYRAQSGDPFTPLESVGIDPVSGAPRPVFGEPFGERLKAYHRFDVRIEKAANYNFGDVLFYVDILNVTGRANIANRSFPLRNAVFSDPGQAGNSASMATISPDDDEGIPFFIAFGVNFSF